MAATELGGVLTGTVVTRDGRPVPHAVVTVVDVTGAQSARTTVGHDGHFTVAGLGPGIHLRSPDFLDVDAFPQIRNSGHRLTALRSPGCSPWAARCASPSTSKPSTSSPEL